jgi:hypothetical protein
MAEMITPRLSGSTRDNHPLMSKLQAMGLQATLLPSECLRLAKLPRSAKSANKQSSAALTMDGLLVFECPEASSGVFRAKNSYGS